AIVALSGQWFWHAHALVSGLTLLGTSGLFFWSSERRGRLNAAHTALVFAGASLGSFGLVDPDAPSSNLLPLGCGLLSLAWLGLLRLYPGRQMLKARSTGLLFYGALG